MTVIEITILYFYIFRQQKMSVAGLTSSVPLNRQKIQYNNKLSKSDIMFIAHQYIFDSVVKQYLNMKQNDLWKQYASALQNQINANNKEREALYQQIGFLKNQQVQISAAHNQKDSELKQKKEYVRALEKRLVRSDRVAYEMNNQNRRLQQALNEMIAIKEFWQSSINEFHLKQSEMRRTEYSKDMEIRRLKTGNSMLQKQIRDLQQALERQRTNKTVEASRIKPIAQIENEYLREKVHELEKIVKMYQDKNLIPADLKQSQSTMISKQSLSLSFDCRPEREIKNCSSSNQPQKLQNYPRLLSMSYLSEDSSCSDIHQLSFSKDGKVKQLDGLLID